MGLTQGAPSITNNLREPKVGKHVLFHERGKTVDALVRVVFHQYGYPRVTLVIVRTGERGPMEKLAVPHLSNSDMCTYWMFPEEAEGL